jgi:hypothetical protein
MQKGMLTTLKLYCFVDLKVIADIMPSYMSGIVILVYSFRVQRYQTYACFIDAPFSTLSFAKVFCILSFVLS